MSRLFVEHLTVIDCASLDARRGLVGQSWIVDLELEGELDDQSMVLDFGLVKKQIKRAIDEGPDHSLIVPARHPGLRLESSQSQVQVWFDCAIGPIVHHSPPAAVTLLDAAEVTPRALAAELETSLLHVVPANVHRLRVQLREELIAGACYHYTHGLKKHDGHCQRIAHGHRSRIEIRVDGERDPQLEQLWASRWTDIYLATREDIVRQRDGRLCTEYQSREGHFRLELPVARCALLETDSTVERIAEHIAEQIAALRPGRAIEVRAYEGVHKGAVAAFPVR
jgi:6-pyruvoyl-tetrahydropterin synthase